MTELASDPRWQRFHDQSFSCSCCGVSFNGVFDLAMDHPGMWPHGSWRDQDEAVLAAGEDRPSSDLCQIGDDQFIRCNLPIAVQGSDKVFSFGVWGNVTRENFQRYWEGWSKGDYGDFEECFSRLCNDLPDFKATEPVPCVLVIGEPTLRSRLFAHQGSGAIADAQAKGISFDALLDIYAASGQDIRPHLMDA